MNIKQLGGTWKSAGGNTAAPPLTVATVKRWPLATVMTAGSAASKAPQWQVSTLAGRWGGMFMWQCGFANGSADHDSARRAPRPCTEQTLPFPEQLLIEDKLDITIRFSSAVGEPKALGAETLMRRRPRLTRGPPLDEVTLADCATHEQVVPAADRIVKLARQPQTRRAHLRWLGATLATGKPAPTRTDVGFR